jgi:TrmH family RNA methyltransferase
VLNAACVNPFSPKVLRASVGAHFALNIIEVPDLHATVAQAQQQRVAVVVTSSHATHSIYAQNLRQPVAWLLGSEGAGVAPDLMALANACVTIPMAAGESLNVAAAAAVCLFEMQRQQSDF